MKHLGHLLLGSFVLLSVPTAYAADVAADYPNRSIKLVVNFPAGGTIDTIARIVGQRMNEIWGQAVVVENRPGAGGNIGAQEVFNAAADGYTLLATPPGPLSINEFLYKDMRFDPASFAAVSMLAGSPNSITVNPKLPIKTVSELIEYAKKNPGKLTYGSQGTGSTSHLTGQMFASMTSTALTHVPYKGEGPAMTDLMAGHIDLFFGNISGVLKLRESGRVNIIAVASDAYPQIASDLPSADKTGLPGFESSAWFALMAPPKTPAAIVEKLNKTLAGMLRESVVQQKFLAQGAAAKWAAPADTDAFIRHERKRWQQVIADAGVTPN